jgi:hypothetical protein
VGAVDVAAVQVQFAQGAQLGQRLFVQGRPDAGLVGCSGVTCWRRLRNWTEAGGQLVSVDPGLEHEHDPGECGAVVDRPAARMAVAAWPRRRQQRRDPLPQPIWHELLDHPPQPQQDRSAVEAGAELILKRSLRRRCISSSVAGGRKSG